MDVTRAIIEVRDEYLRARRAASAWEINNGLCSEFARDVLGMLGGMDGRVIPVWTGDLMIGPDPESPVLGRWDPLLVQRKWGISPPAGLGWQEIDAMHLGNHIWLASGGRHFDAECPHGVEDFFYLPIFRRRIMHFLARCVG